MIPRPTDLQELDDVWVRLTRNFGYRDGGPTLSSILASALPTTEDLTLYVDSVNGNDANGGRKADDAFATVAGALTKVAKEVNHNIVVNLAPGNYGWFSLSGYRISGTGKITLNGAFTPFTTATGLNHGTVTSATDGDDTVPVFGSLSDSTQTWTTNNLKGKFVYFTSGFSQDTYYEILSNSSTTMQLCVGFGVTVPGDTYAILDCASVVNTSSTHSFGLDISDNQISSDGALTVNNVKISIPTVDSSNGISIKNNSGFITCKGCSVVGGSNGNCIAVVLDGFSQVPILDTCLISPNVGSSVYGIVLNNQTALTMFGCHVTSPARNAGGISLQAQGYANQVAIIDSQFDFMVNGLKIFSAQAFFDMSGVIIDTSNGSQCILASSINHSNWGGTVIHSSALKCQNSSTGLQLGGTAVAWINTFAGSGNTIGIQADKGARCQIGASSTITGTTEILLDGVGHTISSMRSANPKLLASAWFSIVFE